MSNLTNSGSTTPADWMDSIDLTKETCCFDIIRHLTDLRFPAEFVSNLALIEAYFDSKKAGTQLEDLATFSTLNGKNLKWWTDNRHVMEGGSIPDGAEEHYFEFLDWVIDMNIGRVRLFEGRREDGSWHTPKTSEFLDDRRTCINAIVEACYTTRRIFTDEELLRYQKEVWRLEVFAVLDEYESKMAQLQRIKDQIQNVADVLHAMREDELQDFVWSDEKPREDAESNERARQRREKFAKPEPDTTEDPDQPAKKSCS